MIRYTDKEILEAKEFYRKEYIKITPVSQRNLQLSALKVFDAYIEYKNGANPYDVAEKYNYSSENFMYAKINIVKTRIDLYLKLKGLDRV